MRTSKAEEIIRADPEKYLWWLKVTKGTGCINEIKNGNIWIEHKVKNGIDRYIVYNPKSKIPKVIKRGIAK